MAPSNGIASWLLPATARGMKATMRYQAPSTMSATGHQRTIEPRSVPSVPVVLSRKRTPITVNATGQVSATIQLPTGRDQ